MKSKVILIILAVGLLVVGTAALVAENFKEGFYKHTGLKMTADPPDDAHGGAIRAKLVNKALALGVPTQGRKLSEIAGDVRNALKVKQDSVQKYKSIIRSFSGAFVQYPQRGLPGYSHL